MEFHDRLQQYMDELDVSVRDLAKECGMSDAVISRYRTGARIPDNPETVEAIAAAIVKLSSGTSEGDAHTVLPLSGADSTGIPTATERYDYNEVLGSFRALLPGLYIDKEDYRVKFRTLLDVLDISLSALSKATNYDSSFLSRVSSGKRYPSDYKAFSTAIADYIVSVCRSRDKYSALMQLTGSVDSTVTDSTHSSKYVSNVTSESVDMTTMSDNMTSMSYGNASDIRKAVLSYLLDDDGNTSTDRNDTDNTDRTSAVLKFVSLIDEFNLDDYIRAVHFDMLKVPTLPSHKGHSRRYFGIEGMKSAELDFLRAASLLPKGQNVYMYSTLPIEPLTEDMKFAKKWMLGLASLLKKGHTLHMIHDMDRPWDELMAGLLNWVPLYMTGQIVPYYMPSDGDSLYNKMIRTAPSAAMWGECIGDDLGTAAFYMTRNQSELPVYEARRQVIYKQAKSLMDIYTEKESDALYAFLDAEAASEGLLHCKRLLSSPPMHTISDRLLMRIMEEHGINDELKNRALKLLNSQRDLAGRCVEEGGRLSEYYPVISREEFDAHLVNLALSGMFPQTDVPYTYDTYMEHVRLTEEKASKTYGYEVYQDTLYPFRNIQITTLDGRWAMVSKNTTPSIHFVIRHPVLVKALSELMPIIFEETC